jgi:hypothetical protein
LRTEKPRKENFRVDFAGAVERDDPHPIWAD